MNDIHGIFQIFRFILYADGTNLTIPISSFSPSYSAKGGDNEVISSNINSERKCYSGMAKHKQTWSFITVDATIVISYRILLLFQNQ